MIAERLVFLDGEPFRAPLVRAPMASGARTNMARRYGRAPRGERVVAAIPHGHWKDDHVHCRPAPRPDYRALRLARSTA